MEKLVAVGVSISAFVIAGCSQRTPEVWFVLPVSFRGCFKLVESPNGRVHAPKTGEEIVLSIPPSGVLELRSLSLFDDWHRMHAKYQDGTILNVDPPGSSQGCFLLFSKTESNRRETWYFIGDRAHMPSSPLDATIGKVEAVNAENRDMAK